MKMLHFVGLIYGIANPFLCALNCQDGRIGCRCEDRQTSGKAVPSCGSRIGGNMNEEDHVYPGLVPFDGGKTLHHALVYIDDDVSSTSLTSLEIICCVLTLGLGECDCDSVPSTN